MGAACTASKIDEATLTMLELAWLQTDAFQWAAEMIAFHVCDHKVEALQFLQRLLELKLEQIKTAIPMLEGARETERRQVEEFIERARARIEGMPVPEKPEPS